MYSESLIGLVNNAALLLALGILYDLLSYRLRGKGRPFFQQILVGVVLSAVGVAIMLNPWNFGQGVVFDTRSVLLCLTGFFFGTLPVVLAVLVTGAFRLFQGGTGAWTGVAVIVTSGGIGLAWRYFRRNRKSDLTLGELYLLGLVVHMAMLGWMLSLPGAMAWEVLSRITLPVILIYPLATALLGKLLLNRENRKLSEVMIRESEEKFRNIFQHHSAVQLIIDPGTGSIVEANEAAEKFYGWSAPELKAMRIQDLNTLSPEAVQAAMEKAGPSQHAHFEFNHRLVDGSIRDVEVYSGKIEVGGKELLHSIIHDITARKRAEEALREREHFLRSIVQTTVDGFWVVDSRGRLTEVNDAYCVMSGYGREELSGMNINDLDAIETTEEIAARIERVRASGWEIFETRHRRKDGSVFPVSMSVTYLDEDAGHFICFSRDLTESRLAEEQLIKSHDLLTNLARLVPGVIYQFRLYPDGSSAFPYASPGMNDIYEVTPEEVREDATPVYGRLHPDDYNRIADAIQESARTLQTFYCQFRVLLPRQGLRWRGSQAQPERMADGSILWHGIISDITERMQAEEALRKSEERLNFALHMSQTGGWDLDLIDHTAYRTIEHDRIFGYESLLPSWTYEMFIDHILPEDRPEVERRFQEAAAAQTDWQFECRIRRIDGEVRWIRAAGCHTPDETGQMRRMAGIVQDITDRKKTEEEKDKLNAQLLQAQKMESVGRLAGGVAHDYNNMLSVIIGYTELALDKLAQADPMHVYLEEVLTAATRSKDITQQLLAFSRQQTIAPKMLDLSETVESMLKMLRRLIGEDIDLAWLPSARPCPVMMDSTQLDQILANLCVNARDAIGDVGKITIETNTKTFDDAYCADHAGYVPGDFVLLSVSDDGCGMDRETQEHLFEPFFTTKETGKGTGLGLATVYGIVRQNNGFINVYSESGQGTTFRIYLPRRGGAAEPGGRKEMAAADARGSETILLVEDEETMLRMTTLMLSRLGYTVLMAGTPGEAIALARENAAAIRLLMTDVVMPGMNGRELARRLQSLYPGLKILFTSGYTANIIAHRGVLDEGVNFIQKPFSKKDLAVKIRETLDAS